MLTEIIAGATVANSLVVMWALGRHYRWGWYVSLGNQVLWSVLAVLTGTVMFAASSFAFGYLALQGLRKWKVPPTK